ncbi:hypothetical protein GSI_02639 [Ganoderma sinense ZZ0214-1]|uniref:Uncharacterized protein n=1 Tax=Ganoderma sinense ZZ0214-1 TaxID=1077348 RepID=A0A2G8SM58_9APHY|nr:hypothetical protein GSI_02639 [Ganoderma sinense ZZ0214-1]
MLQQPAEDSDDNNNSNNNNNNNNNNAMDVDENDLPENILIAPVMSSSPPRAHASTSGRPAHNAGPPPKHPKDFLTSPEARAALTEKELTQEEVRKVLENIEIRKNRAENLSVLFALSLVSVTCNSDATEVDTSIWTMATVHDPGAMDTYPDMLLCHWYAADVEMPADPGDIFGCKKHVLP